MEMDWPLIASEPGWHSHSTALATSSGCTKRCCGLRAKQAFRVPAVRVREVLLRDLLERRVQQFGFGIAGAHRVDGDAFRRDFERERARQTDHAVLRRAIRGDIRVADLPRRARDVDDAAAAAFEHARAARRACRERRR